MKLIIGLGNPGRRYEATRHNTGFRVAEALARELLFSEWHSKFDARFAVGQYGGEKIIIALPQTMMNNSGRAVAKLSRFYKVAPVDIWIIQDDIDLPLGKLRIKQGGTAGGHNGVASVIAELGNSRCVRFKIGVGPKIRPARWARLADRRPAHFNAVSFVLQPFIKTEQETIDNAISEIIVGLTLSLNDGLERAMNYIN